MRGPGATRPAGPDGAKAHELAAAVDELVALEPLLGGGDGAVWARKAALEARVDDLAHPAGRERRVKGGVMVAKRTAAAVEVPRPLEDALAAAEAELAAVPEAIEAVTAAGDEAGLGKLLLRRPILEARVRHLRGQRDSGYLDLLAQHLADARVRHEEVKARLAGIIAALEGQLAVANAEVVEAWAEVLDARYALEEETNRKPSWWYRDRGLVEPGSTPTADSVKRRIVPDRRMAAFYAERGDRRFGPPPVNYEGTKEQHVPFGGRYPGAAGSEVRDPE